MAAVPLSARCGCLNSNYWSPVYSAHRYWHEMVDVVDDCTLGSQESKCVNPNVLILLEYICVWTIETRNKFRAVDDSYTASKSKIVQSVSYAIKEWLGKCSFARSSVPFCILLQRLDFLTAPAWQNEMMMPVASSACQDSMIVGTGSRLIKVCLIKNCNLSLCEHCEWL